MLVTDFNWLPRGTKVRVIKEVSLGNNNFLTVGLIGTIIDNPTMLDNRSVHFKESVSWYSVVPLIADEIEVYIVSVKE